MSVKASTNNLTFVMFVIIARVNHSNRARNRNSEAIVDDANDSPEEHPFSTNIDKCVKKKKRKIEMKYKLKRIVYNLHQ